MAFNKFISLIKVILSLFINSHFLSTKSLNLFFNNLKPLFKIIKRISSF